MVNPASTRQPVPFLSDMPHLPPRPSLLPIVLFLLSILSACGGGSSAPDPDPDPDPVPPTVLNVFPQDLSARTGSTIRFIAELDKPASSYTWDFGGGALPTTATTATEFQPLVILGAPGTYTATLTVCAGACADPFTFTYIVTPNDVPIGGPRILSVTPTGTAGARGTEVTFSAQLEGEADVWEWDFGAGIKEPLQATASPTVRLYRTGIHQGSVTARLSGGTEDHFEFAYEVSAGMVEEPPIIDSLQVGGPLTCDNKHLVLSASIISDFPVTWSWITEGGAYPPITTNSIARYTSRAAGEHLTGHLTVANAFGSVDSAPFQVLVTDCPEATVTQLSAPPLVHGIALTKVQPPASWRMLRWTVDPSGLLIGPSLMEPRNLDTYQLWSVPATGTLQGSVETQLFQTWGAGDRVDFTLTDPGQPTPRPVWQEVLSRTPATGGLAMQILILDERPALFFADPNSHQFTCLIARVADPVDNTDWVEHQIASFSFNGAGFSACLAAGRPAIAFSEDRDINFLVAKQEVPDSTDDWQTINVPLGFGAVLSDLDLNCTSAGHLRLVANRLGGDNGPYFIQATHAAAATPGEFEITRPLALGGSKLELVDTLLWHDRFVTIGGSRMAVAKSDLPRFEEDFSIYTLPLGNVPFVNSLHPGVLVSQSDRLWLLANREQSIGAPWPGVAACWTSALHPENTTDWSSALEFTGMEVGDAPHPVMTVQDGRLLGAFTTSGRWWWYRALSATPAGSVDWVRYPITSADREVTALGPICSAAVQGDHLWIASQTPEDGASTVVIWKTDIPW